MAQRETVQTIWDELDAMRRAAAAMENGNVRRDRGYSGCGFAGISRQYDGAQRRWRADLQEWAARRSRWRSTGPCHAGRKLGRLQGAIGAALEANDRNQAELWLRQALERFPRDSGILSLGARYEQARGDNERAADYWRAALAVMPGGHSG